jgi:hypothetical protein
MVGCVDLPGIDQVALLVELSNESFQVSLRKKINSSFIEVFLLFSGVFPHLDEH